jgi:hypothetical protein
VTHLHGAFIHDCSAPFQHVLQCQHPMAANRSHRRCHTSHLKADVCRPRGVESICCNLEKLDACCTGQACLKQTTMRHDCVVGQPGRSLSKISPTDEAREACCCRKVLQSSVTQ